MGRKRTSDRFDDVGSSGEDSDRSHDAPRRQKRRQGNGIEGKIRKAIQKQATNLKTQAGFLQRLSKIFGPVDDWGIQEVPKKVFAEELTRIVEDVTDMRTASKKFGIAMDKMLDSIDTDENDSISFAEFVAFYAFKEDELRKLVVNISKKVNQQAGDEHYVRRWLKTTAARTGTFTATEIVALFRDFLRISISDREANLIIDHLGPKKHGKKGNSISAKQLGAFLKWECAANLDGRENREPIYEIDVSINSKDEAALSGKGFTSFDFDLNEGKRFKSLSNAVKFWYSKNNRGGKLEPIVDVRIYPSNESATMYADGFTCINKSTNSGVLGKTGGLSSKSVAVYVWYKHGPGGPNNVNAITNLIVTSSKANDAKGIAAEVPAGGYEQVRGDLNMGSSGDTVHLWIQRKQTSHRKTHKQNVGFTPHSPREDKHPLRHVRDQEQTALSSHEGGIIYDRIFHRIRRDIRVHSSVKNDTVDVHKFFKRYAKSNPKKGWKKIEFFNAMKSPELQVHIQKFALEQLFQKVNGDGDNNISESDYRNFILLRPFEVEEIAVEIVNTMERQLGADEDFKDIVKRLYRNKQYTNRKGTIDKNGFANLVADYTDMKFSSTELLRLMTLFDKEVDHQISSGEFLHFLENFDDIVHRASVHRIMQASSVLLKYVQMEYSRVVQSHLKKKNVVIAEAMENAVVTVWNMFSLSKRRGAERAATYGPVEVENILKLASSRFNLGTSVLLSMQELEELVRFIQPKNGKSKPIIDIDTFRHFFDIGADTMNFVTDVIVTHGKSNKKEVDACDKGYYRAGTGLLRGETNFEVSKLWVKYGAGTRKEPPIRQIQIGSRKKFKNKDWTMVPTSLCTDDDDTSMYVWVSTNAHSSNDRGNRGINGLKLQLAKPPRYMSATTPGITINYGKEASAEEHGIPLWVQYCDKFEGPCLLAEQARVEALKEGDVVEVMSQSSDTWEEAQIVKAQRSGKRASYEVMHEDGSLERGIPQEHVRISKNAISSRAEVEHAYGHHRKRRSVSPRPRKNNTDDEYSSSDQEEFSRKKKYSRGRKKMKSKKSRVDFGSDEESQSDEEVDIRPVATSLLRQLKSIVEEEDIDLEGTLEREPSSSRGLVKMTLARKVIQKACGIRVEKDVFEQICRMLKAAKQSNVKISKLARGLGATTSTNNVHGEQDVADSLYGSGTDSDDEARSAAKKMSARQKKYLQRGAAKIVKKFRSNNPKNEVKEWVKDIAKLSTQSTAKKAWLRCLKDLGVRLNSFEKKETLAFYSKHGSFSLGLLHRHLQEIVAKESGSFAGRKAWTTSSTEAELIKKISSSLRRTRAKRLDILNRFQEYDVDFNDSVQLKHFRRVAGELGLGLSGPECRLVQKAFPSEHRGFIAYKSILDKIGLSEKKAALNLTPDSHAGTLVSELRQKLQGASLARGDSHMGDVARPFEYFDRDGSGTVSRDQFRTGLEKLGVVLDNNEVSVLLLKLEVGEGANVDYRAFCKLIEESSVDLEVLRTKVTKRLFETVNNGVSFYDAFAEVDKSGDGRVTRFQFRKTLKILNIVLPEEELRAVMDRFDLEKDGRVVYGSFYQWASPHGSKASIDADALQSRLQHRIREAAMLYPAGFDLRRPFSYFDSGNVGLVSRGQFQRVLKEMNLAVSKGELSYLMDRFGRDRSSVDYFTFAKFARCDEEEMDTIAVRVSARFDDIAREGLDYREVFSMFDIDNSGFITRYEFKEAVRQLGLPLTVPQLHALMERFSHFAGGDKVSYQDVFDFVGVRYRATMTPMTAKAVARVAARETVDGSGHDGLNSAAFETLKATTQNGFFAPRTVEKWLESSASSQQKKAFASIYSSLNRYERRMQSSTPIAVFDHTNNLVSKVASHLPYQIATATSSYNRNKDIGEYFKRNRENEYSDSESSGDQDRDRRRRRRSKSRGFHDTSDSDNSRYGADSRSSDEDTDDRRGRQRRNRSSDDEDSSDNSRRNERQNKNSRRRRPRRKSNYSSDSD